MTDAEYILALESIATWQPHFFEGARTENWSRRVLRAHVEDWWEKQPGPKAEISKKARWFSQNSQVPEGWEIVRHDGGPPNMMLIQPKVAAEPRSLDMSFGRGYRDALTGAALEQMNTSTSRALEDLKQDAEVRAHHRWLELNQHQTNVFAMTEKRREELRQQGLCSQCISEQIGMPEKGLCECGRGRPAESVRNRK